MAEERFQRHLFDAELVTRALKGPDFRRRLIEDPTGVYDEAIRAAMPNLAVPEGVEIRIAQEEENVFYLVLPCVPPGESLSDESLASIARHERTHRLPCWGLGDAPE